MVIIFLCLVRVIIGIMISSAKTKTEKRMHENNNNKVFGRPYWDWNPTP